MGILSWLKRPAAVDSTKTTSRRRSARTWRSPREERIADGADRESAHYAALKEFGNVTLTTEAARRVWTPAVARGRCAIWRATSATRSVRSRRTRPSRSPSSACSRSASA